MICLTIWHLQKQSIYWCLFAFAELILTCWDIRRYEDIPKDWMTISHLASTDGFASTEGSTGLGSQDVGQPWRAKKAIWSDSMFADLFCLFWKVWDFRVCSVLGLFVSGCFYVFLQFNFPLASDLTIGFASWWCFFCFFCFFWLLRHRTCHLFKGFKRLHSVTYQLGCTSNGPRRKPR